MKCTRTLTKLCFLILIISGCGKIERYLQKQRIAKINAANDELVTNTAQTIENDADTSLYIYCSDKDLCPELWREYTWLYKTKDDVYLKKLEYDQSELGTFGTGVYLESSPRRSFRRGTDLLDFFDRNHEDTLAYELRSDTNCTRCGGLRIEFRDQSGVIFEDYIDRGHWTGPDSAHSKMVFIRELVDEVEN